ncbi:SoxR reducing system RseC family protein [Methylomonas paludis]|uniref:SoxR reducing system RseC family protein n=1 Tax=Methylomonas paludis TaxID=1173101 RepID=A0A975MP93_9GAMM|nr:SoxR reducing system RseC family protein [Methylomonas paludis]QWF71280.1 SoxR reducing system RseC family protein [Methylomonas paludis]
MIEQQAVVTQISTGQVWIKSLQSGACGGCMQQNTCSTATLAKLLPKREFAIDCDLGLQVGDEVMVAIDDTHLLATSIIIYLLPVVIMLLSVGLADAYLSDTAAAGLPVIALIVLLLSFWLINRCQSLVLLHVCFKPQIIRKC